MNTIGDSIHDALQRAKELAASNGQKRSNSDDLNFHPAKRSTNATDMAGMGMGGPIGETLVENIDIPDHAVGLVIGKGGEQINLIQQQSGCRVQMAGETTVNGYRQCTLQGPKHCIERARQLVNEVIERSRHNLQGGGGGQQMMGGGGQNGNGMPGYITTELMIPGQKCGLVIGKNGETIKGLQEQIGVKMMLVQDTHQVSTAAKPLRISGTMDKVEHAKRIIENILASEPGTASVSQALRSATGGQMGGGGGGGGPRSVGEVIVPRSSVGIIIGKGGETIKRLAAETGAKIQFKPDDPNLQERCAVIQGTPEQINRATQMISDLVSRSAGGGQQEVFYMHVPANKTGLVIGKGGDTIKQICAESGAHVELSRDPPPNANEKVFVIKGTPYQIHHVQHIIRIKVGDVAPGTPVPSFHGGVTSFAPNPYGPTPHQLGGGADHQNFGAPAAQWAPQNGFVTAASQGGPGQDPSAWTQYYTQQQANFTGAQPGGYATATAQHYQTVPAAIVGGHQQPMHQAQPQQQPMHQQPAVQAQQQQQQIGAATGNPSINPQTGQPDYSAQWAEYYRSMGMHDQAAVIEQQMQLKQGAAAVQQPGRPQQQQLYMQ